MPRICDAPAPLWPKEAPMTADLDLSPEAVERLLFLPRLYLDHEGDLCCEQTGDNLIGFPALGDWPTNNLLNPDMWGAIPKFQALAKALSAENARLRAERDAAWQAGAEAMRKAAARTAAATPTIRSDKAGIAWHDGFTSGCLHAADAIRALPLIARSALRGDRHD